MLFNITNDAQKKTLMLTYAGNELNDTVDSFSEEDLTPGEGETHYTKRFLADKHEAAMLF